MQIRRSRRPLRYDEVDPVLHLVDPVAYFPRHIMIEFLQGGLSFPLEGEFGIMPQGVAGEE
ncbi:hypothetical protein D3C72_2386740 [compost metagenome]